MLYENAAAAAPAEPVSDDRVARSKLVESGGKSIKLRAASRFSTEASGSRRGVRDAAAVFSGHEVAAEESNLGGSIG